MDEVFLDGDDSLFGLDVASGHAFPTEAVPSAVFGDVLLEGSIVDHLESELILLDGESAGLALALGRLGGLNQNPIIAHLL
jgi:hypothetical protein